MPSGIGIVTDELEDLELPSTVELMRERVEFLQKLGLTIDDINEYPLMLEKIGIQRSRLGEFVKNYPQVLHASVVVELVPVVKFLRGLDVEKQDIGYVLMRRKLLHQLLLSTLKFLGLPLKAKLSAQQYFFTLKLKIDPDGFARVIERMPQIVSLNQDVIMKRIEFLLGRAIPAEVVARMVVKCPQIVAVQVGLMKNSYYFFKSEMGRPIKELVEFPEYFTYSLESRIKARYQRLQAKGLDVRWLGSLTAATRDLKKDCKVII
ncbi:unnamed protein product [Thlaspi arvense]|uniref:Uncharacterized protein n=1 Tax=Thlaspi arvense TaxID=13288 RepID=A0AAU9S6P9_THLAR|nr:unnamed protein product [Thlaspi arvense]